jgi:cytochrome c-type biogenesis protein CcmH/NrfG
MPEPVAVVEEPEEPEAVPEPEAVEVLEPEPEVLEPITGIAAFRQQLTTEPDDYVTRLALARALLDDDVLDEALTEYDELISSGQELDDVAADLERVVLSKPADTVARRVLGDTYMKQNRLENALDAYRQALEHL